MSWVVSKNNGERVGKQYKTSQATLYIQWKEGERACRYHAMDVVLKR